MLSALSVGRNNDEDELGKSGYYRSDRCSLDTEREREDEEIVEYNGKTYSVYRTYLKRSDQIELYVERKGGTNGEKVQNQA